MTTLSAKVVDGAHLELSQPVSFPAGTNLRVYIEDEADKTYAQRLEEYYATAGEAALAEEREMAEVLGRGDAPLPREEDPWW